MLQLAEASEEDQDLHRAVEPHDDDDDDSGICLNLFGKGVEGSGCGMIFSD
jgi:hypothetical protein